jgi:hypothetical protein
MSYQFIHEEPYIAFLAREESAASARIVIVFSVHDHGLVL